MDFYMKLPRNKKEFALFMGIISIVSVNIIAPLITCFEAGFHLYVWQDVLTVLPFIWLSIIAIVLLTYIPAEKLTSRIISKNDSFNSHIIVNILCTVFLMSILLTVVGTWIGTRSITLDSALRFLRPYPFPHPSFRDSGYRYKIWNHSHFLISFRELIAFPPRIANPFPTSAPGHNF